MQRDPRRVLVGMSGGVDSSVAAALLVEQGYEVIGITIKTYNYEDVGGNIGNESSCCSLEGINDARRVCLQLGIPHLVVDFTDPFRREVIDYFVREYFRGQTPNPCVRCNRTIKWGELLRKADALGAEYVATGHYARLFYDAERGRYRLLRGRDEQKDQSYALWMLPQAFLARTLFPLGELTKEEVRREAERFGLGIAHKPESYELCFVPDNDYRRFLRQMAPEQAEALQGGPIFYDGRVVGHHEGYPFYTIGQRRGLGIAAPEPLYVLDILPEQNALIVGPQERLYHWGLVADSVNLLAAERLPIEGLRCTVKIRYKDEGALATAWQDGAGRLWVRFDEPRRAITPGQSAVLYNGDELLGGGIITAWWDGLPEVELVVGASETVE
ncbi:MAG: tRNA 2-thiouridine(34) synthase MnmA [Bacteroidota bacterium]|nr:tRNA 2-thiouridine(34) synthase MnmA [Bacteroidota bacterium]